MRPYSPSFRLPLQLSYRLPQPSFRRKPESRPCSHIHRHTGYPHRHSGLRRNLDPGAFGADPVRAAPNRHSGASRNPCLPAPLPHPPTVIPAQAGIYGVRSHSPSFGLPQPSFRLAPESSAALREPSLRRSGPQPSFRRKPESRRAVTFTITPAPPTVIPAQAGIHRKEPLPPAPPKFPISHSNLPEYPRRPKSGHTSALPLAPTPAIAG